MVNEKWKDIVGWEGLYQVSTTGNIKRLPHMAIFKNGNHRQYNERLCTTRKNIHGYIIVQLWKNGHPTNKQLHRLIAEAFIPNPKKLEQVNHINGKKDDNRIENLEWVSRADNSLHAIYTLKRATTIPVKEVMCLNTGKKYPSVRSAARDTGTNPMNISRVALGLRKSKNGTKWVFI